MWTEPPAAVALPSRRNGAPGLRAGQYHYLRTRMNDHGACRSGTSCYPGSFNKIRALSFGCHIYLKSNLIKKELFFDNSWNFA